MNPLAETRDGQLIAADAKLGFDDNAAFRQPEIFAMRDTSQEDPREVAASKFDLNYIGLDGQIGCMVCARLIPKLQCQPVILSVQIKRTTHAALHFE